MSDLRLSLACGLYDRTMPLWDGRVKPEGIELSYLRLGPAEVFWRQLQHHEFDASEMSLSAYIIEVSRGEPRFVAIPAFPSRVFRRGYVFVREGAGIEEPVDLAGKRIGIPEYHMTAALFIRGALADDYGLRAEDMEWIQGGQYAPGRKERIELRLPPGVKLSHEPERTIDQLLLDGDVDALITAYVPDSFREGRPGIKRLFADPAAADREAFARTGIFPIMHLIAIRREVHERHPWIAVNLMQAFEAAKRLAMEDIADHGTSMSMLPFFQPELERTVAEMGEDFWPYGLPANLATLEAAVRYSHEQGLSARKVEVEELFPASLSALHVD